MNAIQYKTLQTKFEHYKSEQRINKFYIYKYAKNYKNIFYNIIYLTKIIIYKT